MKLNLNVIMGEDLRGDPEVPGDFLVAIAEMRAELEKTDAPAERVRILGQLGGLCRNMRMLEESADYLDEALDLIAKNNLSKKLEMVNRIRRAHVVHWSRDFDVSNRRFDDLVEECRSNPELGDLLDFALQHRGKNFFDQQKFKLALTDFREALEIRTRKADLSLIESTSLAIRVIEKESSNS